jgi:hypothetical protein
MRHTVQQSRRVQDPSGYHASATYDQIRLPGLQRQSAGESVEQNNVDHQLPSVQERGESKMDPPAAQQEDPDAHAVD